MRSIRDSWFAFDGTVPHCVLPFQGNRSSIVYFTRVRTFARFGQICGVRLVRSRVRVRVRVRVR